jgi:hypothetical protein
MAQGDTKRFSPAGTLKPCPFDDGRRLVVVRTDRYDNVPADSGEPDVYAYHVFCTSCACQGPWKKSQSGAEQFWNGIPGTQRGGPL